MVLCDVRKTYIETYRGYKIYDVQQVDVHTGEPFRDGSGSKWYEMYNPITGDNMFAMHHWWRVHSSIDYRIKANPRMFGALAKGA